jgi:3'(2'), 5'-bisphosphate nucleotidase
MESPYAHELRIAFSALRAAATLSQSVVSSSEKGVVDKDDPDRDYDPVTVADFAIQALLAATFHHHFPDDGLVGEESADELRRNQRLLEHVWGLISGAAGDASFRAPETKEQACRLIDLCGEGSPGHGRVWVFDPIDGTQGFVRGDLYAINVAMLVDGKQVLSAVACPNLAPDVSSPISDKDVDPSGVGVILFAAKNHGAFIMPLNGEDDAGPRRLKPHPSQPTKDDLRLVCCTTVPKSGSNEFHRAVAASLGMSFPGCDLAPWVARWAALAMGLGNSIVWVYNRFGRRGKVWDHAGAMLLFEETGGKITDVYGRDIDLAAGRDMKANFGFVASLKSLHPVVLEATHEQLRVFGRTDVLREAALLG